MRTIFTRRQIETALAAMLAAVTALIGLAGRDERPLGPKFLALEKVGRFDEPVHVAQPPGGDELYVVEKPGRVVVVDKDGEQRKRPFLDLRRAVKDDGKGGEQGLLSIAFAPDYAESGLSYVAYTDRRDALRVVEYRRKQGDPLRADGKSARLVLRIPQPTTKHHGGLLVFGPDKHLYIGAGDGGPSGDPATRRRASGCCWASCCASTPRSVGASPIRRPRTTPSSAGRAATRSSPTACAIPGDSPSTAPPERSRSATSATSATRRSTSFRPARRAARTSAGRPSRATTS